MNESVLQLISVCKLLWVVVFDAFYAFAGISGKWKRRYVGPTWMMLGIVVFTFWQANIYEINTWSWWYLIYFFLLIGVLSLGYGGNTISEKIMRRFVYGLALAFSVAPLAIVNGAWIIWGIHSILCLTFSVVLGVWNPMRNARDEETLIATSGALFPLFMI